jgi:hypothetical protein
VEVVPLDIWEQSARETGMGEYQLFALIKMFRYYDEHGLVGSPGALTWVLGRQPTSFPEFVRRTLQERAN